MNGKAEVVDYGMWFDATVSAMAYVWQTGGLYYKFSYTKTKDAMVSL